MNRRYAKCVVAGDSPAQSLNHLTGNNRTNPRQRFSLAALRRRVTRSQTRVAASTLYRTARQAVILMALAFALFHSLPARSADGKKSAKSPRALGVVQLLPNGKARLIPVTILYDGEFYDASAYKASPVPMALDSGTVYEGFRTGVSQGLFTVTSALQGNNTWVGNGNWQTTSAITAAADAAAKKKAAMSKPAPEAPEGPPVLRRATPKPKSDDTGSSSPPRLFRALHAPCVHARPCAGSNFSTAASFAWRRRFRPSCLEAPRPGLSAGCAHARCFRDSSHGNRP